MKCIALSTVQVLIPIFRDNAKSSPLLVSMRFLLLHKTEPACQDWDLIARQEWGKSLLPHYRGLLWYREFNWLDWSPTEWLWQRQELPVLRFADSQFLPYPATELSSTHGHPDLIPSSSQSSPQHPLWKSVVPRTAGASWTGILH